MPDNTIIQFRMVAPIEQEGALTDFFDERFDIKTVVYEGVEATNVIIDCYPEDLPKAWLLHHVVQQTFPDVKTELVSLRDEDWAHYWKQHFHPIQPTKRIWVAPPWEPKPEPPPYIALHINPGLSFGTGQHFTTRYCLERLDEIVTDALPDAVLDLGTGSGILALAAHAFGAQHVIGLEHDPMALACAKQNAALNESTDVSFLLADLRESSWGISGKFDLIFANIFSRLLISCAPQIVSYAKKDILLTGIQPDERLSVIHAFVSEGCAVVQETCSEEWCGLHVQAPTTT